MPTNREKIEDTNTRIHDLDVLVTSEFNDFRSYLQQKIDGGSEKFAEILKRLESMEDEWKDNRKSEKDEDEPNNKSQVEEKKLGGIFQKILNPFIKREKQKSKQEIPTKKQSKRENKKSNSFSKKITDMIIKGTSKIYGKTVGKILGGVKGMFSSFASKLFAGAVLLKFLMSPAGMTAIAFISAWFKNTIWIPYAMPIFQGIMIGIDTMKNAWDMIKEWYKNTVDTMTKIFEFLFDLPNTIREMIDTVKTVVSAKIQAIKDKILEKIEPILNAINGAIGKIRNAVAKMLRAMADSKLTFGKVDDMLNNAALKVEVKPLEWVEHPQPRGMSEAVKKAVGDKKAIEDGKDEKRDQEMETLYKQQEQTQSMIINNNISNVNQNVAPTVITIDEDKLMEQRFNIAPLPAF